jgi:hypothetical protein
MKYVSLNILSATSLKSRHLVLMNGGILCKRNKVSVRFFSEGKRPNYIPKEWEWINWEEYPRSHRHIRVISDNLLIQDADYHVFMDDDSLTNVDRMVKKLDHHSVTNIPTIWSGFPGRLLDIPYQEEIKKMETLDISDVNLSNLWVGYEISVINKSLAKAASLSSVPKHVLKLCNFIDQEHKGTSWESPPDLQICIMAELMKANHIRSYAEGCQQWPNYLNYSGLYKKGKLWHIHSIRKNLRVDPNNEYIYKILSQGGSKNMSEIISNLFGVKNSVSADDLINKEFSIDIYYAFWLFGNYVSKASENNPSIKILPNGCIKILKQGERVSEQHNLKWKKIKNGIEIIWNDNFSSCYTCSCEDGIIGWDRIPDGTVQCSILHYL